MRPVSQMDHIRRGSAQSIHSDMGNGGPHHRGGYPYQGRGRGNPNNYGGQYNQQQPYSPGTASFQPNGPNRRGNYQNYNPTRGGGPHQGPYPGSPSMAPRTPAYPNANPGTPTMGQMQMVPGMHGQYQGFPQMGGQQVNRHFSYSQSNPPRGKVGGGRSRGTTTRGRREGTTDTGRGGRQTGFAGNFSDPTVDPPRFVSQPLVPFSFVPTDLSPESGNFERILTGGTQTYLQFQGDPSINYMQEMQRQNAYGHQPPYPGYGPPQSPRPNFTPNPQASYMQQSYSNQGHQPQSMSRQSSQMSMPDRPGSTVGHVPTPSMTPASAQPPTASRAPSVSAPKMTEFQVPRKSKAIAIVNPNTKDIVKVEKPVASPATPAPAKAATPPVPTPSPKIVDPSHSRTDSVNVKSKEELQKGWQEAVARKIAEDKAKAQPDQAENETPQEETVVPEIKVPAPAAAEKITESKADETVVAEVKVIESAVQDQDHESPAAAPAPAAEDEFDIDAFEAEMAAKEAEEARKEEEYAKKRAAQKEAQRKIEEEEEAAYESNMKKMEAEAEERELKKEAERKAAEAKREAGDAAGSDEDSVVSKIDKLRLESPPSPTSEDSPAVHTPEVSGTQTPVSDISMPPPARGMPAGKRGKASELTLNTTKAVEPPEPSATLKSLNSARRLGDPTKIDYPSGIASPNPALNANAPADRKFKYNKEFLLQFQTVFKEKPSLDWDAKIKEALGDGGDNTASVRGGSARTPSGMGPRAQSTRGTVGNAFPMGAFGTGAARNTPVGPGTTSEQRFAMANAGGMTTGRNAPTNNPFAMGRPPGMAMATPMGRNPSNNAMGMLPGSPRGGGPGAGRGASRNESKRKNPKQAAQENNAMPLTVGMDLNPIQVSATGWKPRSIVQAKSGPALGGDGLIAPDEVQRLVKGSLNKMTPEKFDKLSDQILQIAAQSKDEPDGRTLRQVIQLTFEKATDEAHWSPMYAMFCKRMLESMNNDIKDENIKDKAGNVVTGGNLFRKYLLNRCQEEFEKGWKLNLPAKPEGVTEEAAMLSDEYYVQAAAKRHGLGLVRFIGELFKLGMLTERIMHECVKKLLDYEGVPDDAEVESLVSLLETVGSFLDDPASKNQPRMDAYFERITVIMNMPGLLSRLKFALMEVIDLRKNKWRSNKGLKGPKTIQEIHDEAEAAQRQAEASKLAQQANRGGGGRMPSGRGDARFAYGQMPPPDNSNRVNTNDLRGLSNRANRNTSNTAGPGGAFGPGSLLAGRQGSGRRGIGPGMSNNSSRTGTPPQREEKKDEASTNAFR
jgi:translation initiation factor 4G